MSKPKTLDARKAIEAATGDKLITLQKCTELCSLAKTTLRRHIREGTFPPPVRLAPNVTRYLLSEVQAWIADRAANNRTASWGDTLAKRALREAEIAKVLAAVPKIVSEK